MKEIAITKPLLVDKPLIIKCGQKSLKRTVWEVLFSKTNQTKCNPAKKGEML
jgi:hypothetical protein